MSIIPHPARLILEVTLEAVTEIKAVLMWLPKLRVLYVRISANILNVVLKLHSADIRSLIPEN